MSYREHMRAAKMRDHQHRGAELASFDWKRCYLPECEPHHQAHGGTVLRERCKCGAVRYSERRTVALPDGSSVAVRVTGTWRTGSPVHKENTP